MSVRLQNIHFWELIRVRVPRAKTKERYWNWKVRASESTAI